MNDKEKIISYSKETFLENGFYKITMDEIASGLRISKKTIYKYFPSKNKLIETVVKAFQTNIKKRLNKIVNEQENSILKIKTLANFLADLSFEIDQKMLYDLQTHRPDLWKKINSFRSIVIEEIWISIINAGKKEKCIVDKPNDIIITVIISSVSEVISPKFLLNHNYSMKDAFEIMFDIIISGILTDKGRKIYYKSISENKK
jgi:AcrR family transcriptional regulator